MTQDRSSIRQEIERSRRDVLDLSLRNPLISFRPAKRWGVEVVDERSSELFRILVGGLAPGEVTRSDPKPMYFLPAPEKSTAQAEKGEAAIEFEDVPPALYIIFEREDDPEEVAARHSDNKLQTALSRADLTLRLRETARRARASMEEQGVNILYLALAMLKWSNAPRDPVLRRAPLILVPVQLQETGVRERFKLEWTGDDIEPNLSLETKLKHDFRISLPEMPSEGTLDVEEYLSEVERAVAGRDGWKVERNEAHLNFFSFSKLLIYKDLEADAWPKGHRPYDHPLARRLFGPEGFEQVSAEADARVEGALGLEDLHPVRDADSSQTEAVFDAIQGRDLVIQGPPGTGKSQTITNLIAEALHRDRTVLFVSEKMAALEVVKRRLDAIGLGGACLELHSWKTSRYAVRDQLDGALRMSKPKEAPARPNPALLKETRTRLNDYAKAVNEPVGRSGLSPRDLIGKQAKLEVDGSGIEIGDAKSWSYDEFLQRLEVARELQEQVEKLGQLPSEHVWRPFDQPSLSPSEERVLSQALNDARGALRALEQKADKVTALIARAAPFQSLTPRELERIVFALKRALAAPPLLGAIHRDPRWRRAAPRIAKAARAAKEDAEIRARHGGALRPDAWNEIRREDREALCARTRFLIPPKPLREARKKLASLCDGEPPDSVEGRVELVDAVLRARELRRGVDEAREVVDGLFPGRAGKWSDEALGGFASAAEWLRQLSLDKDEGRVGDEVHDLLDRLEGRPKARPIDKNARQEPARVPSRSAIRAAISECEKLMEALAQALDKLGLRTDRLPDGRLLKERAYGEVDAWLAEAVDKAGSIRDVARFNKLERTATELGIGGAAEAAANTDAAWEIGALFESGCYSAWLDAAFDEREALADFDGAAHGREVRRFGKLDEASFKFNRARIAALHQQRYQELRGPEMVVLRRQLQSKRHRLMPVRRLMREAGQAIQTVKPVFMMSPLSIAKYLPPRSVEFDMVVFDEASQVRPVEALGAIVRGRQAIVVGDDKQLPPTAFFDRMADAVEEDASATGDLESILDLFRAQGAPERMLRWHYRSRHESLIEVSNREFYDNRLVVFPSPDANREDVGLEFRRLPDAFYRGRGVNPGEAKAIAQAVMEHAQASPEESLGVAAFGASQARRIEDELYLLRRQDSSCRRFFAKDSEEPFFVKNLENVQGDERDVILISIGYGRKEDGRLSMNFGPVNRIGGERRLNVLITRARRRCVVFSNFVAADLDLQRSGAKGVRALKTFLEYAEANGTEAAALKTPEVGSPFDEILAAKLRERGHDVDRAVGSRGFSINAAVRDPERPGRYVLGIQGDGAAYGGFPFARDRDRLKRQVLERLGWTIHRLWSVDWLRDADGALRAIEDAILAAKEKARLRRKREDRQKQSEEAASTGRGCDAAAAQASGEEDVPKRRPRIEEAIRTARDDAQMLRAAEPAPSRPDGGTQAVAGPAEQQVRPEKEEKVPKRRSRFEEAIRIARGEVDGPIEGQGAPSRLRMPPSRSAPVQSPAPSKQLPEAYGELVEFGAELRGPIEPYVMAELEIRGARGVLAESADRAALWIAGVAEVEGPIHIEEVKERFRAALGERASGRLGVWISDGAKEGARRGRFKIDDSGFLWSEASRAKVRRRDGRLAPSLRDPARIAKEEIATALIRVVRAAYGIKPVGAAAEAARLFGLDQSAEGIEERFKKVLTDLAAHGWIEAGGGGLLWPVRLRYRPEATST